MNKENLNFNINLNLGNNNSGEVPFITISNSKSNSSKNQNSKNSSNKYKSSLTNNNNSSSNSKNNRLNSSFNIIRKKLSQNNNKEQKSSEIISFTDNSLIKPYFDTSFNNQLNKYSSNVSLQEDEKDIKTEIKEKNQEIETPKRRCNNRDKYFTKFKKIKKSVATNENIHGKNLMDYFKYMNANVTNENKNSNRVSSVENISNNTIKLNKKVINTNKSWNKNNKNKNQVKIINKNKKSCSKNKTKIQKKFNINISELSKTKKKSNSNLKISSVKNIRIHNNYFDNLLNKYIHFKNKNNKNEKSNTFKNFQKHSINNNIIYLSGINNINTEKKNNFEKIKITPKTDSYKRKLSCSSYLKIREGASKNLFHDYKQKQNEEININKNIHFDKKRLSVKVIKDKKQVTSSNLFYKIMNSKNTFFKIKSNKKEIIENKNNINIKKISNHNEPNSIFFKFKDKKEIMKQNDKNNNHQINKAFNFINRNIKK